MKAKTNALIALNNIFQRNSTRLTPIFRSNGSANAAGDSLEYFIKDMFCTGAEKYQYDHEKDRVYNQFLSWSGDSSHFPDMIVAGGVGVEPKKVNNESEASIALNSSFPKDYIYPTTQNVPQLSEKSWQKKPIIYAVGNLNTKKGIDENKLFSLWLAYGNTFVADRNVYLSMVNEIRGAIRNASNADLVDSKELARAKGIDYLKYTNLRVRGMYELRHPAKVFGEYVENLNFPKNKSHIYLVMLKSEFDSIKNDMDSRWNDLEKSLQHFMDEGKLTKLDVQLPDPNDLNNKLEAIIFAGYTD